LIIDEIGYQPLGREQANLFFQVVAKGRAAPRCAWAAGCADARAGDSLCEAVRVMAQLLRRVDACRERWQSRGATTCAWPRSGSARIISDDPFSGMCSLN
jgi:hypothetical protein